MIKFLIFIPSLVGANVSVPSFENLKITEVKSKISVEKEKIVQTEVQKRGVMAILYDINKEVSKINLDLTSLEEQLRASKAKIESQSALVAKMEKAKDLQKSKLAVRLRALYKLGAPGYAEVVLSSQSGQELSRNVKFLGIIVGNDAQLLLKFKRTIESLQTEQQKLRAAVKIYLMAEKNLAVEKGKLAEKKEQQTTLLAQIEKDRGLHLLALKEWRQAGLQLEEKFKKWGPYAKEIEDIKQISFFEKQGQLRPPVEREVKQGYGIFTEPRYDIKIFHKGLFFASQPGDSVSSLYTGRVVHAGWINGFGETVIIDHGDHYYSVYAHLSKISKAQGAVVRSGELIGVSGDSGSLRGPGLYLEVRHFSESLDPLPWLDLKSVPRL